MRPVRAACGTERPASVLGSWGKAMRGALMNKERWKGRRAPTQDPSTNMTAWRQFAKRSGGCVTAGRLCGTAAVCSRPRPRVGVHSRVSCSQEVASRARGEEQAHAWLSWCSSLRHISGARVCQRSGPCARGGQTMSSVVGMPVGLLRELWSQARLAPHNTKRYSSTYLAMGFANVRAGTWLSTRVRFCIASAAQ